MSRIIRLAAPGLVALLPLLAAAQPQAPVRLAMMDMMPMGGGTPANQAPMAQQAPMPMQQMQPMQPMQPMQQMRPMQPQQMQPMQPQQMQPMQQMPTQGAGQMQAPGIQQGMPMQQMPMQPGAGGAMSMCPMMSMMMQNMQNMMRMGGGQPGMMPPADGSAAMGAPMGGGNSAARLEGRIAYLRTDLRITDAQAPAWEAFAAALRSGREHLDAARDSLSGANAAADPMVRLQAYESHLMARTEAVRSTRLAFNTLFAQLDDAQKRAATTTMLPFIGTF